MTITQNLNQNTVLLTPNRRLSATLLKKHNQLKITQHYSCWISLDILPFTRWIQRLWKNDTANKINNLTPLALTNQQELLLWEDILRQFPANEALLQLSETAKLAKKAWEILKQWRVDLTHPSLATTEDSHSFIQWAIQFQNKCQENNWIDTYSLIYKIIEKIQTTEIILPERIILRGFTELSPLQKYLFLCLEQKGVQIIDDEKNSPIPIEHHSNKIILRDEETEIYTLARWAKSLIESNPALTIGCIIPNLEKIREPVLSIFSDVFSEKKQLFNITAGKSLSTYPIIHVALKLLSLNHQPVSIETISHLLLSPFLGDAEQEYIKRAELDAHLKKSNITQSTLEKLDLKKYCPRLGTRIKNFLALLNQQPPLNSISAWVNVFTQALGLLGWPGERSLDSHEYQLVQRWLELLTEYQTFDRLFSNKNYQKTLHYLMHLTAAIIFQPKSADAPVQILGILEAIGVPFDYAWAIGFDDSAWPPAAKPNPFIPHSLQSDLKMPNSTSEHEFEYSQRLIEQLRQKTKNSIFSHAQQNTHSELRTSPLIADLSDITIEQLKLAPFLSLAEKSRASQRIETLEDTQASAVAITHTNNTAGGAMIFKLQAACPFKAFAEIRLKAKPIASPMLGLTPQDRGKITHKALELLWKELKDSTQLKNTSDTILKDTINTVIADAIKTILNKNSFSSRYLTLESKRLHKLLWDWLHIEKQRPPFKVIACEEECSVTIANLAITLRVDRIDEVIDTANHINHLIIDYKTGYTNSIKHWFGDRLEEPQLPLYCMTATTHAPMNIAFAEINPINLGFKGISQNDLEIENIALISDISYSENRPWKEQAITWQNTLEKLGSDFANGYAAVDPKLEIETCRYCHLHAFCRVYEN